MTSQCKVLLLLICVIYLERFGLGKWATCKFKELVLHRGKQTGGPSLRKLTADQLWNPVPQLWEPIQVQRVDSCQPWQKSQLTQCNISHLVAQTEGRGNESFLCINSYCLNKNKIEYLGIFLTALCSQLVVGETYSILLTVSLKNMLSWITTFLCKCGSNLQSSN